MKFFDGLVVGMVVALGIAGIVTVNVEHRAWNKAVDKSASALLLNTNKFGGLDSNYDLGYNRCQEDGYDLIKELKHE